MNKGKCAVCFEATPSGEEFCSADCLRKTLCVWCETKLPKKKWGDRVFCGKQCEADALANFYPSWVTGRVGPESDRTLHKTGDFLCLSAPNKYRNMLRKRRSEYITRAIVIVNQGLDFPELVNPCGLDVDYPSFDLVLTWRP